MRTLHVTEIATRGFRNLVAQEVSLGPRFNVLSGDNGQGKTNFLEAVYVALTSKSFRAQKVVELVAHGDGDREGAENGERDEALPAFIRANVKEDDDGRTQIIGFRAGQRQVKIDGKRPPSLAEYAVRSPVVVFHPREMELTMGASAERRKLLDRVALYAAPVALDALDRYTRAMRARQRVLETRGVAAEDLIAWESLMAEHGAALMAHRRRACERVAERAAAVFAKIGTPDVALTIDYAPGAEEDLDAFTRELLTMRPADMRRGSANRGPHRDDMRVSLGGHVARGSASQGQHRAIVLSLKAAEIEVIGAARGVRPILLLDDVSSELDRDRTASLFSFLREQEGQVLLTTTRRELIELGTGGAVRVDYTVCAGALTRSVSA